jgi:hypothetical protein
MRFSPVRSFTSPFLRKLRIGFVQDDGANWGLGNEAATFVTDFLENKF